MTGKKTRILFVSQEGEGADSELHLYWLLKTLDREQYEAIVTVHKDGPLLKMVESLGWPVVKLQRIRLAKHERPPLQGLGERLTWWLWKKTRGERVVQLIREKNIDLVHTTSMMCFEGAYAAHKTHRPHLWHIHEILPGNRRLFGVFGTRKTLKMIARYSDKVVCVSDAAKRQFTGWQRQPDKYVTIYDGVDADTFNPDTTPMPSPSLRETLNIPEHSVLLAYSGPITRQNGFSDLVDTCVLLRQDGVDFHLIVTGATPDLEFLAQMESMIAKSSLTNRIHFLGAPPRDAMPGYLKQMDIFVDPAHQAPFSYRLLEAMAMKLPVVGNNTGGIAELITPNQTGLLAKTGVPGSLAKQIKHLVENPALRQTLGEAGRKSVLAQFHIADCVQRIQHLYPPMLQAALASSETHA